MSLANYMGAFGGGPTPGAEQRIGARSESVVQPEGVRGGTSTIDPFAMLSNPNSGGFERERTPEQQAYTGQPLRTPDPSQWTAPAANPTIDMGSGSPLSAFSNPNWTGNPMSGVSTWDNPTGQTPQTPTAPTSTPTQPNQSPAQSTQGLSLATNQLNPLQFQTGGNWNYGGMSGAVSDTGWLQKGSAEEVAKMMGGKLVQGIAPGYDMRAGDGNPLNEWLIELPDGRRANAAQLGKYLQQGQQFAQGQGSRSNYFMQDTINQALANGNFFGQTKSPYGADMPGSFDTIEERNTKLQNQANNLPALNITSQVGSTPTGYNNTPQNFNQGGYMQQQGYGQGQGSGQGTPGYQGTGQNPFTQGGGLGSYLQQNPWAGFNPYSGQQSGYGGMNPFGGMNFGFNPQMQQIQQMFNPGLYNNARGMMRQQAPLFNNNYQYYLPFGANFAGNNRRFSFQ